MTHTDHVQLIKDGIMSSGGAWADLGSGAGAFTLALRDVAGPEVEILSVDQDAGALIQQRQAMDSHFPETTIQYIQADFSQPLNLPALDGMIMANSLHFIPRSLQPGLLGQLKRY